MSFFKVNEVNLPELNYTNLKIIRSSSHKFKFLTNVKIEPHVREFKNIKYLLLINILLKLPSNLVKLKSRLFTTIQFALLIFDFPNFKYTVEAENHCLSFETRCNNAKHINKTSKTSHLQHSLGKNF